MPASIAILAPSPVPFQTGGSERFWLGLRSALDAFGGVNAELIKLPVKEHSFADIIDAYHKFSQLDLSHFDMLISTKYPAWIAPHPNHVCYMQHTLRGLYDTYHFTGLPDKLGQVPDGLADLMALVRSQKPGRDDLPRFFELVTAAFARKSLPSSLFAFPGPLIREIVHFLDRIALAPGQMRAWLAISATVAGRRDYLPADVPVRILHHPSDIARFASRNGEYFFTASRLNPTKRVRLLVDAMKLVPGDVELRIAGEGPDLDFLRARAGSDGRIRFLGRVPDAELVELYAGAIAVPFVPLDEDYGLITIEAMHSAKPVITTTDSGGVCEMVRNGETGLIVEPAPQALAQAMTRLAQDRDSAAAMGSRARESVKNINWRQNVLDLLAHVRQEENSARRQILVAAPFGADAHGAGGPRRLWHFCAALAARYNVRLVCPGSKILAAPREEQLLPHFWQTSLPWPPAALPCADKLAAETGQSCDDIALLRHAGESGGLVAALAALAADSDCAVLSHPWLFYALQKAAPDLPLLYDAHNVEQALKKDMFGADALAAETAAAESSLCAQAEAVFVCSREDAAAFAAAGVSPEKLHLLPHGCEPGVSREGRRELRRRLAYPTAPIALFIGSGHRPNQDAALAIMELAPQLPGLQFLLAGTVSTQHAVRAAARPANVHLLGEIGERSKNVLLQAADIALNPVISGSGVNLKSLEYLACGIPLVTTPFGLRGLSGDFAPVAHVCDLAYFPQKLAELMADPPDEGELMRAAAKFARAWSWSETLKPLCEAVETVCGKKC
ncbi:MAG: glycosyltransferase family 4 protein [Desulfovibrio sp.]|nr:glycosyltransferase family 4 protein [Desulfovibrio sp.]